MIFHPDKLFGEKLPGAQEVTHRFILFIRNINLGKKAAGEIPGKFPRVNFVGLLGFSCFSRDQGRCNNRAIKAGFFHFPDKAEAYIARFIAEPGPFYRFKSTNPFY